MTEEELRALVRDAVARHLHDTSGTASAASAQWGGGAALPHQSSATPPHPSFVRYVLPAGDGHCLIEPAVRCTHCGFCQSHGY
jgi:hypothetical protein